MNQPFTEDDFAAIPMAYGSVRNEVVRVVTRIANEKAKQIQEETLNPVTERYQLLLCAMHDIRDWKPGRWLGWETIRKIRAYAESIILDIRLGPSKNGRSPLLKAIEPCLDWMEHALVEMECREDEDCDHCVGQQFLEQARKVLWGRW